MPVCDDIDVNSAHQLNDPLSCGNVSVMFALICKEERDIQCEYLDFRDELGCALRGYTV